MADKLDRKPVHTLASDLSTVAAQVALVVGEGWTGKVGALKGVGVVAVENKHCNCCTLPHPSCCCFVGSRHHSAATGSCSHTLPCRQNFC